MSESVPLRERLRKAIVDGAFVRGEDAPYIRPDGTKKTSGWLFDIRAIALSGTVMNDVATLFWETFGSRYPFQIGGLESGAIPLVSALVMHGFNAHKHNDISGFFIRKSRKKTGLAQMIEGTVQQNRKIVLVDDLMNSGESFIRQVEVLEAEGHKVEAVWTLVRYRDTAYYTYFQERGIEIYSVFTLDDFVDSLGTANLVDERDLAQISTFKELWKFESSEPNYFYVVPKSEVLVENGLVYMGSDQGVMWAIKSSDGTVAWSVKIGSHVKGKGIFSSPKIHDGILYFGGYDGNVYALDAKTGKKIWVSLDADWVGSSPSLAPDLGLLFIGLEFGTFRKRGGIIALDLKTGKKKWWFAEMPCFTHASPLYIAEKKQVVIGSNDGAVYLFDAVTGKLQWKYQDSLRTEDELNSGFSGVDIKGACAYDKKHDRVIYQNTKNAVVALNRRTGAKIHEFIAEFGFYASPLVYENKIYAASLDKHLYCIDAQSFKELWRWDAGARIFATPTIIEDSLFIGSNTGRLTELDPATGEERGAHTLTERITNKIAYEPSSKRYFVSTYANEIYCLERI